MLVAIGYWCSAVPAFAQEAVSYTVSPTIYDMTANPGQVFRSTLRIINTNSFELRLFVDTQDFVPRGEDGIPQFLPAGSTGESGNTLAKWITSDREIVIAPEQTLELPFVVSVPTDAAPGGHFAALMIGTKPLTDGGGANDVRTAQTISTLLFLRVTGDVREQGAIRSFRTTDYILSKPEAVFELRIENKGNVHVQPQGEIKIYNMWGQERGTIPVNQQALFGNVLPNSVRKFAFEWTSEWSITDIGRYTAVATLAYGVDTRQFMTADTAFWIIPWKFLLLIFGVLGAFIALVTWAIKLYVRHMLRLAGVKPQNEVTVTVPDDVAITAKIGKGKKKVVTKSKSKAYTVPLEMGILDLRDSLKGKRTVLEKLRGLGSFVRQYWKFFFVAVAVLFFIVLVALFIRGALTPERDFEVRMVEPGGGSRVLTPTENATTTATTSSALIASTSTSSLDISSSTASSTE